ncbi:anhydro-N-acetylmuramic acid kinase AnmK [Geobacillus icigianus]|uniref:Anhydro-N-acetylmuramic acid kinase n=1 Tax=Geobacillus icigianus TaxID=1430331 RepID=A0ABU6BBQ7_9BACL|nr:anhydro-N-acetylmuramic acid kinase AnmK [Geobacillus icigianus]MEB3749250.1 Anhydro-N-acetylmuramic acid kinase [Geobacillus icigianus]
MLVVGLMSGTSLDGIDASLVKIDGFGTSTKIKVIKSTFLPYEQTLKEELLSAMDKKRSNVEQICSLNFKLGYLFADGVKKVCREADIPLSQIDLIGSHGQTIYHLPNPLPPLTKSSLQIGDPSVLAYETKTLVVSNFRAMDIAAGGEGAPLIPYIDWLLFRSKRKGRILQNIGGIGNCTVLKRNAKKEDIIAFDTGPGNMIIDELCRTLLNIPYDANGEIASQGKVPHDVIAKLMDHDFFKKSPPKSTGREEFGREFTLKMIKNFSDLSPKDLIATATYFTAYSIAEAYKRFVFPEAKIDEIVVSGGGGNNKTLLKMIQSLLPDKKLIKMDDLGVTADEKEAVGFAVLANEYIHQQKTNMPKATGAKEFVLLGQLTFPPYGDQKKLLTKTLLT